MTSVTEECDIRHKFRTFLLDVSGSQKLKQTKDSLLEVIARGNQTYDQVPIGGEVIEVAWLDEHVRLLKNIDCQILVGSFAGSPQNCIPTTFRVEQFA